MKHASKSLTVLDIILATAISGIMLGFFFQQIL